MPGGSYYQQVAVPGPNWRPCGYTVFHWNSVVNGIHCGHISVMEIEEEHLDAMFRGRCTHEQKRRWEQAAKLAKRSLSDWLRIIADEAAEQALERSQKNQVKK